MDEKIKAELKGWGKDLAEIAVVFAIIILFSKFFLGPHMLLPLVAVTSCSMYHEGNLWNGVGCTPASEGWDKWFIEHNISREKVAGFPFINGFSKGDMIITVTPDGKGVILPFFSETGIGDVVIYDKDKMHLKKESMITPIIHRVAGVVEVRNWEVTGVEGTLDCLSIEDFKQTYIPYVKDCIEGRNCPYGDIHPKTGDFSFYITKGDNNAKFSDQCSGNGGIALPVTDTQLVARGWIRIPYVGWLKLFLTDFIDIIL